MPRKLHKCIENECTRLTNGKRCRHHASILLKKTPYTGTERSRHYALLKKYNLTLEEFDVYWIACRGRCFICEIEMEQPKAQKGQNLKCVSVDHDHVTGKVRGLLCGGCNKGLGMFQDSVNNLQKAIRYLNYEA